jgi:hypothetical protein
MFFCTTKIKESGQPEAKGGSINNHLALYGRRLLGALPDLKGWRQAIAYRKPECQVLER